MDKEYAEKYVKENGILSLIKELVSSGEQETAYSLIENCWGDSDEEIADYIEEEWNF